MENETPIPPLSSRIASLVHTHFDGLPVRSKPTIHPDGSREWIPMSAIVVVKGENTSSEKLTCVAVTTGAKCLSASQLSQCRGLVLHDCHAEILAIRAFNYWLLNECHGFLTQESKPKESLPEDDSKSNSPVSPYIRRRSKNDPNHAWPPFELCPDIKIYMYCTCAPCGDASMELCMAAQEDATPWEVTSPKPDPNASNPEDDDPSTNLLDGRAHFSILGVVRRKPARMDAESTRSKSCSDKLALRQVSSLLSHETSLLVAPTRNAYLEGVILPEEEISRVGCERSFSETGRMKALNGRLWPENEDKHDHGCGYGYRFHPFKILSVPTEQIESLWPFAKPKPTIFTQETSKKSKPGNVSAIWTIAPSLPSHPTPLTLDNGSKSLPVLRGSKTGLYETIINGVKQGNRASSPLARGASALSRAKLWSLLRGVLQAPGFHSGQVASGLQDPQIDGLYSAADFEDPLLHDDVLRRVLEASTYQELKRALLSSKSTNARDKAMQDAKRVLKGWIPNSGDENWGLDVLVDPKKRKR